MIGEKTHLPGSTVGVMGGGQLGRMFAIAARRMGYRIHTFSQEEDTPTGQLSDLEIAASYEDEKAVTDFARGIDVLTFEFENIPAQSVEWCAPFCDVRPSGRILHIAQNRLREKQFLAAAGLPIAPFAVVNRQNELPAALASIGIPAVLKSADFGYDGKGQRTIRSADLSAIELPAPQCVLEKFVTYAKELSVLVARGIDGAMKTYPVCENIHHNHILDLTIVPAGISKAVERDAAQLACEVAANLDLIGLLAVEMFLLEDETLIINEIAPRPHNSGHFSFDACITSQFEQQLRAVCGLPLGSTELLRPCAMANLLGDLWAGGEPDWLAASAFDDVKLHLYGKATARPGRKMGHMIAFGRDTAHAALRAQAARSALRKSLVS